ncbi:MAG: AAA family ATPase [Deltaproteobacteria bacterium]|nr:AAA family ATPase [Deltaproteobacteria bacterium]
MPIFASGFLNIRKIYDSSKTIVFRATRATDSLPVILKTIKAPLLDNDRISRFEQAYQIISSLVTEGVIKCYGLERHGQKPVLILEDIGADSLDRLMSKQRLDVALALRLAIRIAAVLARIHSRLVIHKDINPANIIWNPANDEFRIIDFDIASFAARQKIALIPPDYLEGTLSYISPEQTGRMNRVLDYRTDYYSLGATLYEMLTGVPPFQAQDSMELLHCHLAVKPIPPHERTPGLAPILSEIVLKLMSKNPEERYQSALGLQHDLEKCLQDLSTTGSLSSFPLGRLDYSDRFQIPQKLYGRGQQAEEILSAFARICDGKAEFLFISGYSGVGKTSLVHEIYRPITEKRGYFIEGKFDQFQRNIPYYAWIQAFKTATNFWLMEGEDKLAAWREAITAAVGDNGRVLTEVIPDLELIIGPQPPIPVLGGQESQNRFNYVFTNFIKAIACEEHPFVIFLDDLQWIDTASLNLLRLLAADDELSHLLIIGAYRDNEVDESHPLLLEINDLKARNPRLHQMSVGNLSREEVRSLVAESLNCSPTGTGSLNDLVYGKTLGNAFFVHQLLYTLNEEGLLYFDETTRGWRWDLEAMQNLVISENVVHLLIQKLHRLPALTQDFLKLAACIGSRFSLKMLAIIAETTENQARENLQPALREGYIHPLEADQKFAHDRIQQAAYLLISERDREAVHWRIGRLLLQQILPEKREESLFDLVGHLNKGHKLIQEPDERKELIRLNLSAGKKANASTAYGPGQSYYAFALRLLQENDWQDDYQLSLLAHQEAVETAYLNHDFPTMESLAAMVLEQAQTLSDKIPVYEVLIQAYATQSNIHKSIETALHVLKLLQAELPENPEQTDIAEAMQTINQLMAAQMVADLDQLPEMDQPEVLNTMRILASIVAPSYNANPHLMILIVLKMVILSIQHGNTPLSTVAYSMYGLILSGVLGDYDASYQFGRLSLRLLERFDAHALRARTYHIVYSFTLHWKAHLRETLAPLWEAHQIGLASGDFEFVGHALHVHFLNSIYTGRQLEALKAEIPIRTTILKNHKQVYHRERVYKQMVVNLLGEFAEKPWILTGRYCQEEKAIQTFSEVGDISGVAMFHVTKLVLAYHFDQYSLALGHAPKAEENLYGLPGLILVPLLYFYDSLTRLALFPEMEEATQKEILAKVASNQEMMKNWADYAPMNFLHKYHLVEAERSAAVGDYLEAEELYEKALEGAKRHEYIQEEALACQLYARFWHRRGQGRIVRQFMKNAYALYHLWGAKAITAHLEAQHPHWLGLSSSGQVDQTRLSSSLARDMDINAFLKSTQIITGEIAQDKLLTKMMRTVLEHAGAQKGVLLLERSGQWVVEAQGAVEDREVKLLQAIPFNTETATEIGVSETIVNYVIRTQKYVVLVDAAHEGEFVRCNHVLRNQPKSILCLPLINQKQLNGVLYLENNLVAGAFTDKRVMILNLLSGHMAISIQNAALYANLQLVNENLEQLVSLRTRELSDAFKDLGSKHTQLEKAHADLKVEIAERRKAEEEIKTLRGLLPICSHCKKIRDDTGYWSQVEEFISEHSEAKFSHSICPECIKKLYPEIAEKVLKKTEDTKK